MGQPHLRLPGLLDAAHSPAAAGHEIAGRPAASGVHVRLVGRQSPALEAVGSAVSGDGWKDMPGQPRLCETCGKPIHLRKHAVWLKTDEPKRSWHFDCRPKRERLP